MTNIDVERVNQIAAGVVENTLKQFEDALLVDEVFIAELYGKMVVAHALGWNIGSMAEEAANAGDRLIAAVETAEQETTVEG
jgi:hypothetical protein